MLQVHMKRASSNEHYVASRNTLDLQQQTIDQSSCMMLLATGDA
jgi:hypothetical protein